MKKPAQSHPRAKWFARLLIVPALLLAGYAGMQLAPLVQSTASHVSQHTQQASECPTAGARCP
jgi:hypothetical protein